jgi:hypothetical protein
MKTINFAGHVVIATKQANTIWINCAALGWDFDLNNTQNRALADRLHALIVKA